MAIDFVKVWVKAGDGGKGCRSFFKNRRMRFPRADGGCGGNGADVVIQVDPSLNTLRSYHFRQHFKAKSGGHGSSSRKRGKDREALILKVPPGTIVKDALSGKALRNLVSEGDSVVVAKGGRGGVGNAYTKDKDVVPPKPGEERELILELKYVSDVGIIGFPSVGKSSLLNALTGAGAKTAEYHFTTRNPVIGALSDLDIVVADMPGLIKGAHTGKGLGDKFLRHIERTKILLHVIDVSDLDLCPDALSRFSAINEEMRLYNPDILKKPQIVVLNKMDLVNDKDKFSSCSGVFGKGVPVVLVSAKTGAGLEDLLDVMEKVIRDVK